MGRTILRSLIASCGLAQVKKWLEQEVEAPGWEPLRVSGERTHSSRCSLRRGRADRGVHSHGAWRLTQSCAA